MRNNCEYSHAIFTARIHLENFSLILQEDDNHWTPAQDELDVDEPDASSTDLDLSKCVIYTM